jgi:murein DD-endopeptidase MepM/ murein hydrolase activator NlpD
MGRKYFVFAVGLFSAFFFQVVGESRESFEFETVHSLVLDDVDIYDVANSFSGEGWLENKIVKGQVDLHKQYEESAVAPILTDHSQVRTYKKGYATWIEEKICPNSPLIDEPLRSRITSRYGRRVHPISGRSHHHAGIDYRGRTGTPVYASAPGKVKSVRRKGAYGKTVIVDHGNRYTTLYGHLSAYAVREGQWVNQGQTLGFIGQTGRATGPHLHFEVRCHNVPINPIKYLGKAGLVAEVKMRKRMRSLRTEPQRSVASTQRDPNYYTRMINMRTLQNLNQNENKKF